MSQSTSSFKKVMTPLFATACICALGLSLVGCGNTGDKPAPNTPEKSQNTGKSTDKDSQSYTNETKDESKEKTSTEGVQQGSSQAQSDNQSSSLQSQGGTQTGINGAEGSIPLTTAIKTFQKNFQNVPLNKIELKHDDGAYFYSIKGFADKTIQQMIINANTGDIVKTYTVEIPNTKHTFNYEDVMPVQEAFHNATKASAGDWICDEWTLDFSSDKGLIYKFELESVDRSHDLEVTLNAKSGKVLEMDH